MANPENKQIPYESTQKDIRDAIESVATAIGGITHPDAEDIVYDNSVSGLSATDVQNAIDELSSEKADSSSLATVATSGDYDDLINKPTIPTVNDATLTIQKNGSDVATFTANASSNVVANVTVPTTTSELTNNSDFVSDASYVHTDNNFTNAEKTKLSGIESGAEVNVQSDWNEDDNTKDDYIKNKPSSEVKSTTDIFTTVNGGLLEECIINLEPVQSGSGDPSPDNVRPISGHTEVDLYNMGKNKCPLTIDNIKAINTAGTWSGNVYTSTTGATFEINTNDDGAISSIKVDTDGTLASNASLYLQRNITSSVYPNEMTMNGCPSGGGTTTYRIICQLQPSPNTNLAYDSGNGKNFTIPDDGNNYQLLLRVQSGYSASNLIFYPMLRLASDTDPTFEPYQGKLYQVQIGSTVYGGYVDLVSGVMTVDNALITFDGSGDETISKLSGNYNRYTMGLPSDSMTWTDASTKTGKLLSNKFSETTNNLTYSGGTGIHYRATGVHEVVVSFGLGEPSTLADFKTWLGNIPLQVLYWFDTPQTIQLTPQQIETLVGENNLSCPLDGQSIQTNGVEYREVFAFDDVEKAVSLRVPISMLGADESGRTTASQSYASGDYFYKDGYMCKALTSISAGATLTLNTNYSQGTLADILKAIENA